MPDGRTLKLQPTALQLVDETGAPISGDVSMAAGDVGSAGADGPNGKSDVGFHTRCERWQQEGEQTFFKRGGGGGF